MTNPLTSLAKVVAADLKAAGISENEASQRTGIARSTLKRRLLSGDFTYRELWLIADLLETTPAKIQGRAEKRAA